MSDLKAYDPFSDQDDGLIKGSGMSGAVHIRIQQRNGRKTLTTVQGIDTKYDLKKIIKVAKKEFSCNGTVVEHTEYGEVIQLQGDQREAIKNMLIDSGLVKRENVKVHGF